MTRDDLSESLNVCAMAKRFRGYAVGEEDGTILRELQQIPKKRRKLIWMASGRSAKAEKEAIAYAKEHGGTVFGPAGQRIASFGPVRYAEG